MDSAAERLDLLSALGQQKARVRAKVELPRGGWPRKLWLGEELDKYGQKKACPWGDERANTERMEPRLGVWSLGGVRGIARRQPQGDQPDTITGER